MLHWTLRKALHELKCSRVVLAKLHNLSLFSTSSVFSIIFEELNSDENIKSIKETVINIPSYVLTIEFENQLDKVVVANSDALVSANSDALVSANSDALVSANSDALKITNKNKQEISLSKCLAHLEKIQASVIVNLLLHTNNYVWGILSFQYRNCPFYIKGNNVDEEYCSIMKEYKNKIQASISL